MSARLQSSRASDSGSRISPWLILGGVVLIAGIGAALWWWQGQARERAAIEAIVEEARDLRRRGEASESRVKLREAQRRAPESWSVAYELGRTHLALNEPADAIDQFDRALDEAPTGEKPKIHLQLGHAYHRQFSARGDEISDSFAKASFLDASEDVECAAEAQYSLGMLHIRAKRFDKAIDTWEAYVRDHPDHESVEETKGRLEELRAVVDKR